MAGPTSALPRGPQAQIVETELGVHLLAVDGVRIYQVGAEAALALDPRDGVRVDDMLAQGCALVRGGADAPLPPVRTLVLTGAQQRLPVEVVLSEIDRLFAQLGAGERVRLVFHGGDLLEHRTVLHAATEWAAQRAAAAGVGASFAVTTNGLLLSARDADFFERYGFDVTVGFDCVGSTYDRLRSLRSSQGGYDKIMACVAGLLERQQRMRVSARVRVTPQHLCLPETLALFIGMGFHSVEFVPTVSAPSASPSFHGSDLEALLEQMIACGSEFERQVLAGRPYPFVNMTHALAAIRDDQRQRDPCGSAAPAAGASLALIHDQCQHCWARNLCDGAPCDITQRGQQICQYIQGWLRYCLQAFVRLASAQPDLLASLAPSP